MTIAKELAEAHGGEILVSSQVHTHTRTHTHTHTHTQPHTHTHTRLDLAPGGEILVSSHDQET